MDGYTKRMLALIAFLAVTLAVDLSIYFFVL